MQSLPNGESSAQATQDCRTGISISANAVQGAAHVARNFWVSTNKSVSVQLCKQCFYSALEDEIHETIVKNRLFKPGERIAVAASGISSKCITAWLLLSSLPQESSLTETCHGTDTCPFKRGLLCAPAQAVCIARALTLLSPHFCWQAARTLLCLRTSSQPSMSGTAMGWTCSCCQLTRASQVIMLDHALPDNV